jgi:hypothetical protein
MYDLFLFLDDESATIMNDPVLTLDCIPDTLTTKQVRKIFENQFGDHSYIKLESLDTSTWSSAKIGQAMWDIHTLMMDSIAVIPSDNRDIIHDMGESLADMFGNDSSTYAACDTFNKLLKKNAVQILMYPSADSDLWYEDMI